MMVSRSVQWLIQPPEVIDWALFSACDSSYLRYAISLVRSIDLFSPGITVVLHIVNPAPDTFERIRRLSDALKHTSLYVSSESIELGHLDPEQQRAYYASARFHRVRSLIETYKCPIFSLDADSLVVNPFHTDFSDKPTAEIVLVRRDLEAEQPAHLAIATGSIWFKPTDAVSRLLARVAVEIDRRLEAAELHWFVDQVVFYTELKTTPEPIGFFNIKRRYADWDFGAASIVWAGKGGRKVHDMRFFLLQNLLSDEDDRRTTANLVAEQIYREAASQEDWFARKVSGLVYRSKRIAIYLPRLDLAWKRGKSLKAVAPALSDDVIDLRLQWKAFVLRFANMLERAGHAVDLFEIPAWEIDRRRIESDGSALAVIPHRCHLNFEDGPTPVLFYMQEFFRWAFVLDERGWSAASTQYPVRLPAKPLRTGAFEEYRARLESGILGSKFAQAPRKSLSQLLDDGSLPASKRKWYGRGAQCVPYIFFPLQIPTDQSIQLFSDVAELPLVSALVEWARAKNIVLVLKPHPASPKSMAVFEKFYDGKHVFKSEANVQDLIAHATAVYTINSGVGFEAMLHLKPVVTFGRVEYDCVSIPGTIADLDAAWRLVEEDSIEQRQQRYKAFLDWFLGEYAIDLSRPEVAEARLAEVALSVSQRLNPQTATSKADNAHVG